MDHQQRLVQMEDCRMHITATNPANPKLYNSSSVLSDLLRIRASVLVPAPCGTQELHVGEGKSVLPKLLGRAVGSRKPNEREKTCCYRCRKHPPAARPVAKVVSAVRFAVTTTQIMWKIRHRDNWHPVRPAK